MEQNILENEKREKKTGCATWFAVPGCGCGCLILLLGFAGPAPLIPFFFPALFISSGEHLPKAEQFSPEATNYSYYCAYNHHYEFDISEEAFLKMCKNEEYEPVAIETLPDLPPFDHEANRDQPRINYRREVPMTIVRYVYHKEEHRDGCDPWTSEKCNVDPSGKTDDSCFHSVSKGYYYEIRFVSGGGRTILYDSENSRCYTYANLH